MKLLKIHGILGEGKFAIIDNEDYKKVNKYKWYWDGHYVIRYLDAREGSSQRIHRLLLDAQKGQIVDHINRNTLDNQKKNLRFCTPKESVLNRTLKETNFKKYKIITKNSISIIKCKLCGKSIEKGERYHDAQKLNRAHISCVTS